MSEPAADLATPDEAALPSHRASLLARLPTILALSGATAFALALALRPLAHDDLFWQLRTGDWILHHRAVPHADLFSFTRLGAPWVTHEWGFALLSYGGFRLAGYVGLQALTALATLATFAAVALRTAIAARPAARGAAGRAASTLPVIPVIAGLCGLGLWTVTTEVFLRAALLGEAMLALALLGLTVYSRSGDRRALAGVVAVFFFWANLHSGVVFGLFALGLYALEPLLGKLVVPRWPSLAAAFPRRAAAPYIWTLLGALAASLANPNGIQALLYPFRLSQILFASGIDWDLGHFAAASPTHNPGFLLLAALLAAALLSRSGARRPIPAFAELATVIAFGVLALLVPRLVFDFAVVALPVLGELLLRLQQEGADAAPAEGGAGASRLRQLIIPGGIAAVLCLAGGREWAAHSARPISRDLPEGGVRFLAQAGVRGRMFNHQNFGGFLGWRLQEPIFWDGRNDVFASLVREATTTPFAEVAARYGVDHLVLAENEYRDLQPELATGRWGLVYWDDDCAVYLRRSGRFAPFLLRGELRLFPPFGGRPGLRELALAPAAAAGVRGELDRVLALYPRNQRALYFEGVLSLYQGDTAAARRSLAAAARLGPSEQVALALDRVAAIGGSSRR